MSQTSYFNFLDIETVPKVEHFDSLDESEQALFLKRFEHKRTTITTHQESDLITETAAVRSVVPKTRPQTDQELWLSQASLYAEHNKVIVVSIGTFVNDYLFVKAFFNHNEKTVLTQVADALSKIATCKLGGHNTKEFDFPILCRKFMIHNIRIPKVLESFNQAADAIKPWDTCTFDTMDLYGAGQWKYRVSLDMLARVFGLASPKSILESTPIHQIYYQNEEGQEGIRKLAHYCNGDVLTTMQIFQRIMGREVTRKVVLSLGEWVVFTNEIDKTVHVIIDHKYTPSDFTTIEHARMRDKESAMAKARSIQIEKQYKFMENDAV